MVDEIAVVDELNALNGAVGQTAEGGIDIAVGVVDDGAGDDERIGVEVERGGIGINVVHAAEDAAVEHELIGVLVPDERLSDVGVGECGVRRDEV